ncbi:MAG: glycosyltransferase [Terriglobales bacterium]|jgi:rhamnosyl/mannosyltransferase
MRVLQLGKFYDPVVGGMESALREICETLHQQVDLRVVVANTRCRTEHDSKTVPVTRVASLGKLFSLSMAPTFPLWARRFNADLIHVHLPNPLAELSAMLANRDVPVVAHFHSDIVRQRKLLKIYRPFLEAFYRRVNCIIVPTPRHIEISEFVSKHRDKCRVVPFGIPIERFELDESGHKRADELRNGPPTVLCVGRLVGYKGVEVLIRAFANINARLLIIGTGPLESSLKLLAQKTNVADRVEFAGHVPDEELASYYHGSELFVLPSVSNAEMFGIVQLEAMACRKPVISTNLPTGVPWVNEHGKTGLVVPPGDVEALAESIRYLLANPARRQEMGEAGRARVEQHFTSARMAESLLQIFQEMVTEPYWLEVPAKRPRSEGVLAGPGEKYVNTGSSL